MRLLIFIAILGAILFVTTTALDAAKRAKINRFMNKLRTENNLAAVGVALVENGNVVQTSDYGFVTMADGVYERGTLGYIPFCQGAITETFTATLLANILARNQSYTWDTPVRDILGDDFRLGDRYVSYHVTLRDVMSHRTGVSNMDGIVEHGALSREDIVNNLIFAPTVHDFRSKHVHSSAMMAVIQNVIEELGQDDYERLLSDLVLGPLNMTSSTYFVDHSEKEHTKFAKPYVQIGGKRVLVPWDVQRTAASIPATNGLCSSTKDMAKWLQYHLRDPPAMLKETYAPTAILDLDHTYSHSARLVKNVYVWDSHESAGLGWTNGHFSRYKTLSASGSSYGYESLIRLLPSRGIGVWVSFTGASGRKAEAIRRLTGAFVLDMLISGNSTITKDKIIPTRDAIIKLIPKSKPVDRKSGEKSKSRQRDVYIGTYENAMFGVLNVSIDNTSTDGLWLQYGDITPGYNLVPTGVRDEFYMDASKSDHLKILRDDKPTPVVYFRVKPPNDDATTTSAPAQTVEDEENNDVKVVSVVVPGLDEYTPEFFKDFDREATLMWVRNKVVNYCVQSGAVTNRYSAFLLVVIILFVRF